MQMRAVGAAISNRRHLQGNGSAGFDVFNHGTAAAQESALLHRRLTVDSFSALVQPHLDKLYRIAFRLAGSHDTAEDLVQELVSRLWERPGRLAEAESAEAWLVRSLHHLHIDMIRRERRRPEGAALELNEAILAGHARDGMAGEQAWRMQRVLRLVEQLPEPQRIVVVLHDMEGYSFEEIANALELRTGTVKSRLGRAHKKLRQAFSGNAFGPADVYDGEDEVQTDAVSTV